MAIGTRKQYTENMKADIDFIQQSIIDDVLDPQDEFSGIFTYLNAGAEQIIFQIPESDRNYIKSIFIDLVNITNDGTVSLYSKIDDVNYRLLETYDFTASGVNDGVLINLEIPLQTAFKITYTEGSDEGADRDIPYRYILRD